MNKVDSGKRELQTPEFYSLGLGEPLPVSAHHNQGVGPLLDAVLETLPEAEAPPPVQGVGLAIVGRPNTGKSSLLNALLGEERAIVSDIPGTTRDAVDTVIEYKGQPITVIDTAGVRKRGRVSRGVERFSVLRALRAVERADVTVLLLDASELDAAQDAHIAGFALDAYKGRGDRGEQVGPRARPRNRSRTRPRESCGAGSGSPAICPWCSSPR